jgi:hypothetical protein
MKAITKLYFRYNLAQLIKTAFMSSSFLTLSAYILMLPLLVNAGTTVGSSGEKPLQSAGTANDILLANGLTLTLQERLRGEWRSDNFDFDSNRDTLTDDSWLLQRFRAGLHWEAVPWLHFQAEGQDTREWFSDRPKHLGQLGAEGDDCFDLRQGFVELGDAKEFSLRLGRQVLVYGDKRLISSGEWGNASRTFDAIKLHYQRSDWWVDAFTSSVVKSREAQFNQSTWLNGESDNQYFSGLYGSTKALGFQTTDPYALELHQDDNGGTNFVTLGTRWAGDATKLGGWDYPVEMAAQTGELKGRDHSAFAGHWDLGYNWLSSSWKPRMGIEYSHASGDSDAADGRTTTFQNLFPKNHLYYS